MLRGLGEPSARVSDLGFRGLGELSKLSEISRDDDSA